MAKNNKGFVVKPKVGIKEKLNKKVKTLDSGAKQSGFKPSESATFSLNKSKENPLKGRKFALNNKNAVNNKKASTDAEKKSGRISSPKSAQNSKAVVFGGSKEKKRIQIDLKDKKTQIILAICVASILVVVLLSVVAVGIVRDIETKNNVTVNVSMGDFPKLKYYVGEEADYTGLSVAVTKKNGKIEYVKFSDANASDFAFSGFDSSRPREDQIITVIYNGFSCSYHITVKEVPKPKPTLVGITIDVMPKTEYNVGEWLNTDGGMLLKHYSDGTTVRTVMVNNYIVDGWDEAWSGGAGETGIATYTLTVRYKEEGSKAVTTTYEITVIDPNAVPEGE